MSRSEGFFRSADAHLKLRRLALNAIALLMTAAGCNVTPTDRDSQPGGELSNRPQPLRAASCRYRENAFRAGVHPPRRLHAAEPDLSGLPPLTSDPIVVVEIRIDATGHVTESCLLRGVRDDIDRRALDAVHTWVFEPPRLRSSVGGPDGQFEAGTAVPIFMTVTVRVAGR